MRYVLKKGSTSNAIFLEARDPERNQTPVAGLLAGSDGAYAVFDNASPSRSSAMINNGRPL